jgi:hypothetical protein
MSKNRPEWEEYWVGEAGEFSTTCRPFETVYHIALFAKGWDSIHYLSRTSGRQNKCQGTT